MPTVARLLTSIAVVACVAASAPAALATSSAKEITAAATSGVAYLRSLQETSGAIPGFGGDWSLTALAATGTAAANVKKTASSTSARSWYRELVGDTETWPEEPEPAVTEFERASLIAYAAGIDPARVSQTQNLIAQIVARYQTGNPGYYGPPALLNGTVFALLALEGAKTTKGVRRVPQVLLNQSIEVLRKNQHTDGGWNFEQVEGNEKALKSSAEPDVTGAAMAALCGAGVPATDPAIVKGRDYLQSLLVSSTGAFSAELGVNTDSNAWAVQGLNTCAINAQGPEFTTSAGKTPIDFLISQQLTSGAFKYLPSQSTANEYSSQDAVRALAGGGFTPAPPEPNGAPQWEAEKNFSTSKDVDGLLTLIIDNGTSTLDVCAVEIAPGAHKTKLVKVLDAAETASAPAACVTAFTPASGKGLIKSINGVASTPESKWEISIDGGAEKQAKGTTAIELGDTIYLRLS
jgi:hypothetical protein